MTELTVAQIAEAAIRAAKAGQLDDADLYWREVFRLEPNHPQASFSLGVHALQRGELAAAREHLLRAQHISPRDLLVLMTLASVCRFQNDREGEREAIEATLLIDPYYLPGLLAKGFWLATHVGAVPAANMFRNALRVAPPENDWPALLREQLLQAKDFVTRYSQDYQAFLEERVKTLRSTLPVAAQGRWREATAILSGVSRPFTSDSNQLHVPRLPAIPFFDRELFPWASTLEAKTAEIRAEIESLISTKAPGFAPYIGYQPGEPVNQWQELNHSDRWSAYHLWRSGQEVTENLSRCPATRAALSAVGLADIAGLCPNAMFSALAPHTRIPPHQGETNARIIIHLPLIVPERCRYRVGFDECEWEVGKILAFDDTLEHEARNDSDQLRVVLIFDVWNPLLSPAEQEIVRVMTESARLFARA